MRSQHFAGFAFVLFLISTDVVPQAVGASKDVGAEFVGTWTLTDSEDEPFDVVISPNGTAITNWTKGDAGARGESGLWKAAKDRITINYGDGWSDIIVRTRHGYRKISFGPGESREGKPTNSGPATRVEGPRLPFVGVWKGTGALNHEPFFIALKSDGTARKTLAPDAEGLWNVVNGQVTIRWNDGWLSILERTKGGVAEAAWSPDTPFNQQPTGVAKITPVRLKK